MKTPATLSPRPAVWHALCAQLGAEGYRYNNSTAEWAKDGQRGRIAWNDTAAWLRHADGTTSHRGQA